MTQNPRGTKDLFGEEIEKWQYVKRILRKCACTYNYSEMSTPTFEHFETFKHNFTDEEVSANKEMFFIKGDKYVLRPENTAPIIRSVISNKLLNGDNDLLSYFYSAKCFRYERPQSGRKREFSQFGFEKINAHGVNHDLELLTLSYRIFYSFDTQATLKVNFLSDAKTKKKWNDALTIYFEKHKDELTETSKEKIHKNPLRIFDDKVDSKKDVVQNAPKIFDFLSDKEKKDIASIKHYLCRMLIPFVWDDTLVRGIDYYTGMVFEWQDKDGLALAAGGRYDELFTKFGSPKPVPALGFAIGLNRLLAHLDSVNFPWPKFQHPQVYVAYFATRVNKTLLCAISHLRESGIEFHINWNITDLSEHFRQAKKINFKHMLIFGENEDRMAQIIYKRQNSKVQLILDLYENMTIMKDVLAAINYVE